MYKFLVTPLSKFCIHYSKYTDQFIFSVRILIDIKHIYLLKYIPSSMNCIYK